ncbi:MAG TPA: BMP family ABC transporter substrate-binding protein [Brevefilum sp.]|nr:BMP family ABC transporter substrate-binding protein [Brevefilum sp.]
MLKKSVLFIIAVLMISALVLTACKPKAPAEEPIAPVEEPAAPVEEPAAPVEEPEEFVFGILMVGPYNDRGYSQAHYEAGLYVEEKLPGTRMIYLDSVNTADRPGTTAAQLGEELVAQGAKMVIFNSDDMKDDAIEFTKNNPDIFVIHASGDTQWSDGENYIPLDNMVNVMGRMEYGKMIGGCDAALHSETGSIGYLGPLINEETRRLAAAAYLGARYCWEEYLELDPADLNFRVTWIGFWFNIPGFTEDPTLVAQEFINSDVDVIISGIDTTEGLIEARKAAGEGARVFAIPYDYIGACDEAPEVCLGVPWFNWGPAYLRHITNATTGNWQAVYEWLGPSWEDLNNFDTTNVGYLTGPAVEPNAAILLESFIDELAGGLNLWAGPLNLQDGSPWLAAGEFATDTQVWYLPQLLEGMEGRSE